MGGDGSLQRDSMDGPRFQARRRSRPPASRSKPAGQVGTRSAPHDSEPGVLLAPAFTMVPHAFQVDGVLRVSPQYATFRAIKDYGEVVA